jgi:hypothetical protein
MKTDDFLDLLARQAGAAPRQQVSRTLGTALTLGALLSLALVLGFKPLVPASFWAGAAPWIKLMYGLALAGAALWWLERSARPGAEQTTAQGGVLLVVGLMAVLALAAWLLAPEAARASSLLGKDPLGCVRNVALAAVPIWLGLMWALRRLAPTRLRAAGAAAGLAAGALGSVIYALFCTETGVPFIAAWYTAGALLVAAVGAGIAPRVLRW